MTMRQGLLGNQRYLFAPSADALPGLSDNDVGARAMVVDRRVLFSWDGTQWVQNTSGLTTVLCTSPGTTRNSANDATDNVYQNLLTTSIPYGLMVLSSGCRINLFYQCSGTTTAKQVNLIVGAGAVGAPSWSTALQGNSYAVTFYPNGAMTQITAMNSNGDAVNTNNNFVTPNADFNAPVVFQFQVKWGVQNVVGEFFKLINARIEVYS